MWVMLPDCFLSIVKKDCAPDELLVRARRAGDIQKVFLGVPVTRTDNADYRYRAVVKAARVAEAIAGEVGDIDYDNFKNAVSDGPLHDAYLRVWSAMFDLQPKLKKRKDRRR